MQYPGWLMWTAVMLLFLVPPMGYGWAYRGWGPPYPRYVQRRRAVRAAVNGDPSTFNHESWGWSADLLWMTLALGMFWAISSFWWV